MPKKTRHSDPFHQRESKKYEIPVPSREFILDYLAGQSAPKSLKELIEAFELHQEEEFEGLRRRLLAMERDGQLITTRRGRYGLSDKMNLIPGRVVSTREDYGFLITEDEHADIFLPAQEMVQVFQNDKVLIQVVPKRGKHRRDRSDKRQEGRIVRVLQRNTHQLVGRYMIEDGVSFVRPCNRSIHQDIVVMEGGSTSDVGDYVVVKIVHQPTRRRAPMGRIAECLGKAQQSGLAREVAIRNHELPHRWPEEVLSEAKMIATVVTDEEVQARKDLRSLAFVTIDGEDAKDFDDAVYCQQESFGWKLWVAIADVAHYVKSDGELDREACQRGNSVYFPNQVIPMLPESLSNEMCSLKPKADRLVMVCEMDIDKKGVLIDSWIYDGVIHSQARLTYTQVARCLEKKDKSFEQYANLVTLHACYKKLFTQREERGAIEFNTTDTYMIFNQQGTLQSILPRERNVAHRIIEEAMLLANVTVAKFCRQHKLPALYRNHNSPSEEKIVALRKFLQVMGLRLTGGDEPRPSDYMHLLKRIAKRADFHLIQTVMLRSLNQAVYSNQPGEHFGLAYDDYTHFTSPIRRYPDLIVHRALKYHFQAKKSHQVSDEQREQLSQLAAHFSLTERRADLATRDAEDWLKCDYMQGKLGEVFPGHIVEVTGFGLFVELDDIFVQGLLHVTALPNDYYDYDPTRFQMRGQRSGKTYQIGDALSVRLSRVDLEEHKLDFDCAEE